MLGGVRSGKSTFAERLAADCGGPVLYLATATVTDEEMAERIARHRAQRPSTWGTIEEPHHVAQRAAAAVRSQPTTTILVEDLTLLLSNLMTEEAATGPEERAIDQVHGLIALPANLILVSNEVGMGVVPPYPSGRFFRDALGRLNQAAASACDEVYFVVAGLPLRLK